MYELIDEYKTCNGDKITLSRSPSTKLYSVDCWDCQDRSRWHLEFTNEDDARKQFGRFK